MFSSLGLFASSPCPDPSCHRPRCFFSHGQSSKSTTPKRVPGAAKVSDGAKRKVSSSVSPVKKHKMAEIPSAIRDPTPKSANGHGGVNVVTRPPEVGINRVRS